MSGRARLALALHEAGLTDEQIAAYPLIGPDVPLFSNSERVRRTIQSERVRSTQVRTGRLRPSTEDVVHGLVALTSVAPSTTGTS